MWIGYDLSVCSAVVACAGIWMIMGMACPLVPAVAPAVTGFKAMNWVKLLVPNLPMMVLGAARSLAALLVVIICPGDKMFPAVEGMYVMGRMVGQDWFPAVAATNWILANCCG